MKKENKKGKITDTLTIKLGISRAELCRRYGIPQRTVENWDAGISNPPEWVWSLLERVVDDDCKKERK